MKLSRRKNIKRGKPEGAANVVTGINTSNPVSVWEAVGEVAVIQSLEDLMDGPPVNQEEGPERGGGRGLRRNL